MLIAHSLRRRPKRQWHSTKWLAGNALQNRLYPTTGNGLPVKWNPGGGMPVSSSTTPKGKWQPLFFRQVMPNFPPHPNTCWLQKSRNWKKWKLWNWKRQKKQICLRTNWLSSIFRRKKRQSIPWNHTNYRKVLIGSLTNGAVNRIPYCMSVRWTEVKKYRSPM